jgi:cytochrome c-type biogenesis protein CcmH
MREQQEFVVPAKAGIYRSTVFVSERWIPAFAGTTRWMGGTFALSLVALVLLALSCTPAHAVRPDEMLADQTLETRARKVGEELRCLVCRNQSIEDSEADLAHDLRVLVRERIKAGDSDGQTIDYIHARYGDFVLLRPPFQADTLLLWGGPLLVLLIGGFTAWRFYRRRAELPGPAPLSADERRRLDTLLEQGNES